jgi:predicted transcriptional regulator/Tfp pilus assembly protein FimT
MKTQQLSKEKARSSKTEELLKLQLTEAMRLIRELQRSNAELLRQNASILQINSNALLGNRNNIQINEDDRFINDVLSLITDNNQHSYDSFTSINDNKSGISDSNVSEIDNDISFKDKSRMKKDNKPVISDNSKSKTDSSIRVNDNDSGIIEIGGKKFDKKTLIERLQFQINFQENKDFKEEELIKIWRERFHQYQKAINENMNNHRRKVPASYLLDKPDLKNELVYQDAFDKIYWAFRVLNKRKRKNMPALKRQVNMLIRLYSVIGCKPQELFSSCGVTAITGFRYIANLRNLGFVSCSGRGTGGHYSITPQGERFLRETT